MQDRAATRSPIVVASKPFTESYLLAEMVAQLLERRGLAVERRIGLGATDVAFAAIRRGDIDVYPEYTGTGLQVLLGDSATGLSAAETYRRVAAGSVRAFDVTWLPPLGFENTYAIAVSRRTAERLRLRTLADLGRPDVALRAGLTPDFIGRADGLPRLQQVTGWTPRETRPLSAVVKYSALRSASVDVIDAYSTDGRLAGDSLVVLTDNVSAFPPYEASLVVSARLRDTQPHVIALLTQLSGMIDEGAMRRCNAALELEGAELRRTAARALDELALPRGQGDAARQMLRPPRAGLLDAAWWADMPRWLGRHFFLALTALTLAVIVGGTFGTWLALSARRADLLLRLLGAIQTIPGIALLVLCIPLFGIGAPPAIFALWLYALLPIVQGVYTGLRFTDRATLQASVALGLSPWQQLRDVRIPLAAPALISALRTASVLTVGGATLAAFVGGGGLGEPIATGLSLADQRLVLAGAIPSALLAILLDLLLAGLARLVTPAHLR
jgi:osmoprotectant transport system permease protein